MNINEKYFRCYATVDLDNICYNMQLMRKNITEKTNLIAVIKTDGYGHGAVPIAKAIDYMCYGYAVATPEEGHILRKHGITKPIFILGYVPHSDYQLIVDEEMLPPVFSIEDAKELSKVAKQSEKVAKINIASDTGMSRIGYIPSKDAVDEIKEISKLENIKIESIFTHFAKADYKDKSSANKQLNIFKEFINDIEKAGVNIPIHQCANSAATMEMPNTAMDIDRVGISLYGLYPSDEMDQENMKLKPAMNLYSHVIYVKTIEKGRGVSYGHTFIADKDMTVATIPIGYGDGYPRNLSNKGYVLIHGKKAPIIGRVCMDQFMVDVSDIEDVCVGDKVTLAGTDGDETILIDDLSVLAGTFNYEFVCDLGKRVPRVYLKDGKVVGTKDYFDDTYNINL